MCGYYCRVLVGLVRGVLGYMGNCASGIYRERGKWEGKEGTETGSLVDWLVSSFVFWVFGWRGWGCMNGGMDEMEGTTM